MKEKNKNRIERSEMLRYFNGEMTGRQKHSFERRLQRELFSGEAAEGLSEITGEQLGSDLEQLDKRLENRTSRKKTFTFLRIAASLAVLLVVSSVFIFLNRKNNQEQLPQLAVNKPVTMDIRKTEPLKEGESPVVESVTAETSNEQTIRSDSSVAAEPLKAEDQEVHEDIADAAKADIPIQSIPAQTEARPSEPLATRQMAETAPVSAAGGSELKKVANVMEKDVTDKDTVSSILNIVDITGPGQGAPPSPVGGRSAFENYIRNNIRKPASLPAGERATVVLGMIVRNSGVIDSIRVVSSPGQEFSSEATRLIKEGPSWNPAENNGIKTDEKIRIRIIFK